MTWTKTGTEFWKQLAHEGYSDAAARTHAEAIAHLYEVVQLPEQVELAEEVLVLLTFEPFHVRRFAGSPDYELGVAEILSRGAWHQDPSGRYQLVHHAEVVAQSLLSQRKKKRTDVKAQRAARNRRRGVPVIDDARNDPRDEVIDPDEQADKQTARQGKEAPHVPEPRASDAWPEVRRPPLDLDSGQARDSWRTAAKGYEK